MFSAQTYIDRRRKLQDTTKNGLLIFLGNNETPMNYPDNAYRFRQDSSFLYYWGIDAPGLAAILDVDNNAEIIFGHDFSIDEIVWMGPQPSLQERAERVGVKKIGTSEKFAESVKEARKQGRELHFLPQYRADNAIKLAGLLELSPQQVNERVSEAFMRAVIAQRSVKSEEELAEIEKALSISYDMHTQAMRLCAPGKIEQEIAGEIEGIALSQGGCLAFPPIVTKHGETLHNHYYGNTLQKGDLLVIDSGASAPSHYASDITRAIPVSGKFTDTQKTIYERVLAAQETAISATQAGVRFRDVHLKAAGVLAGGLHDLNLLRGDIDDTVAAGAHALFFPHGLGHMMGLDVHDLEAIDENMTGYDEETQRSTQFGLSALRIGKRLEAGYVLTIEPGLYFIPQLIDQWREENKFAEFINYEEVEKYRGFGGIRIEDNVVVTASGCRVLGKPIPKSVAEVEALASENQ